METSCTSDSTSSLKPLAEGTIRGLRRLSFASGKDFNCVENEFRDLLRLRNLGMLRLDKPWKDTLVEALALQELQEVYAERNGQRILTPSFRLPQKESQR